MTADEDTHHQRPPGSRDHPPPLEGTAVGKGKAGNDKCSDVPKDEISCDSNTKNEHRISYVIATIRRVFLREEPDISETLFLADQPEAEQVGQDTFKFARQKPDPISMRLGLVDQLKEGLDDLSYGLAGMKAVHALRIDWIRHGKRPAQQADVGHDDGTHGTTASSGFKTLPWGDRCRCNKIEGSFHKVEESFRHGCRQRSQPGCKYAL